MMKRKNDEKRPFTGPPGSAFRLPHNHVRRSIKQHAGRRSMPDMRIVHGGPIRHCIMMASFAFNAPKAQTGQTGLLRALYRRPTAMHWPLLPRQQRMQPITTLTKLHNSTLLPYFKIYTFNGRCRGRLSHKKTDKTDLEALQKTLLRILIRKYSTLTIC
ncbi:hypothetical protein [Allorhizobium ampelinum]|nr:hypothetical protein [Allorhizobium ampelinum]MVA71989.1 hypothetical protein [Agrobacterium vitis]